MKEVHYLSLEIVVAIHDEMIAQYGGSYGIRDLGLIQSAIARPEASFGGQDLYIDIFAKAAALFHSLMFNPAFVDGNKRTTMTSVARFLFLNGYELEANDEEFVSFPLNVENNHLDLEEIGKWLEKHARKR